MSAESSNLSNIEHRAVIKHFVKKGKTPKEIFEDMVSLLQESAPSYTMVKNGLAYFNKDESCEDDPRPGRPVTKVFYYGLLAKGDYYEWPILREFIGSGTRGNSQKRRGSYRAECSFYKTTQVTKCGFVVVPEPESSPTSTQRSWLDMDAHGTLIICWRTLLLGNASVHSARVSRQALKDTGFSEIDHLPYSPDLAPSDYFLFSNLRKELRGRRFVDDNQIKMTVESHFDCKEKEYFLGGLKALYTQM
ncbi:Mariner Mos1 transposase [Eumeta japonica]|uniref:Mariner Mos1 transposase n=1 Tax=Eumeta variegata TaxID=151549 RepID=A0A4C2AC74_EUMVA|nr:Mariner Mos1 transposase [Eumeta japonica]